MSRVVPLLCAVCVVGIGATAWLMLDSRTAVDANVPTGTVVLTPTRSSALVEARRTCTVSALEDVVRGQQQRCRDDATNAEHWHVLADALLEKVQARAHRHGLVVGAPTWTTLPADVAADLDAGLAAIERCRALGHDVPDLARIEAGLLGQRITGLATALQWNGRIQAALANAVERGKDDPRVHVALGVKHLLAPRLFGHDPAKALEHLEFAAKALADDERPAVFAAMASYLQKKRQQAIEWLEKAVARNPNNVFARVVLGRVKRDEPDPFGRDIEEREAAEPK